MQKASGFMLLRIGFDYPISPFAIRFINPLNTPQNDNEFCPNSKTRNSIKKVNGLRRMGIPSCFQPFFKGKQL